MYLCGISQASADPHGFKPANVVNAANRCTIAVLNHAGASNPPPDPPTTACTGCQDFPGQGGPSIPTSGPCMVTGGAKLCTNAAYKDLIDQSECPTNYDFCAATTTPPITTHTTQKTAVSSFTPTTAASTVPVCGVGGNASSFRTRQEMERAGWVFSSTDKTMFYTKKENKPDFSTECENSTRTIYCGFENGKEVGSIELKLAQTLGTKGVATVVFGNGYASVHF